VRLNRRSGAVAAVAMTVVALGATAAMASTPHQQAKPRPAAAGFMLSSNMNNRCLEVREGNRGNGALVTIWDCGGWESERWEFNGNGPIYNPNIGKCLDIVAANHENGAAVNLYDCHGDWGAQQWRWDGAQIRSNMSHRCLEISGRNWFVGATVQLWDCNGGNHQHWHVVN
jgi:Ricin-type beta-trefoil lectin domain